MKALFVALLLSMPLVAVAAEETPAVPAAQTTTEPTKPALPSGMKQYWFVMLKKGPSRDHAPDEAKSIQAGHMANIQAYAERGQLQIAGPFMDDGDWRGIFILDVPDRGAAEAICNDDPAVKAGRLVCEIHPWLSQVGATLK
jgi:uncharacterized protein